MKRDSWSISAALVLTMAILGLGYISFGFLPMLVFSSGFGIGLVLWLIFAAQPPFERLKWPLLLAAIFFVLHRIEEYLSRFFDTLSRLTDTATPDVASWQLVALVVLSVGGWLATPFLLARGWAFGYYLAWTFFAATGISELAHIVLFPALAGQPIGYFPGMATVFVLAPAAWWGMRRLAA